MILFRLKRYIKTAKPTTLNILKVFYQIHVGNNGSDVFSYTKNNTIERVIIINHRFLIYRLRSKNINIELSHFDCYNTELTITNETNATTIKVTSEGHYAIEKTYNKPCIQHDKLSQINSLRTIWY